mmetsp:Transcript_17351/g.24509  ORF Transcript_17351/g.24509 Transcript_17351/m.24509 type:complete len:647 (+) Transcript_17351:111-2051(+)
MQGRSNNFNQVLPQSSFQKPGAADAARNIASKPHAVIGHTPRNQAVIKSEPTVNGNVSNNSNGGGSGNNSDNSGSGLVSIGNNSFGFNFDSEESSPTSETCTKNDNQSTVKSEPTQKINGSLAPIVKAEPNPSQITPTCIQHNAARIIQQPQIQQPRQSQQVSVNPMLSMVNKQRPCVNQNVMPASNMTLPQLNKPITKCKTQNTEYKSNATMAADAVVNLNDIASKYALSKPLNQNRLTPTAVVTQQAAAKIKLEGGMPQPDYSSSGTGASSVGVMNNDWSSSTSTSTHMPQSAGHSYGPLPSATMNQHTPTNPEVSSGPASAKKRKKVDDCKREERNAREKERSFRISKQINELRNLLSSGGVIVPKGTKSSVLTEAANYIRMLQQHQYRSEIDRHQLIQQMQIIGGGALGAQAASAIRHVAAQNGVWSLGNFGGLPPRSAMSPYDPQSSTDDKQDDQQQNQSEIDTTVTNSIEEYEYRYIFNSCSVGMAIASMGGAFIDCNSLFTQLSQYTKQEVCSMTIFNLTSRVDLQHAFDLISQMISPASEGSDDKSPPRCILRGSMKQRTDLGLSITLVKGDDGIAKCFCITLIKNPSSPFDTSKPIPATAEFLHNTSSYQSLPPQNSTTTGDQKKQENMSSPAYMSG